MSDRTRRRAFTIAATVIILAAAVTGLITQPRTARHPAVAGATARRPLVLGGVGAGHGAGPRAPRHGTPSTVGGGVPPTSQVIDVAMRFAAAFSRYEVGQLTPSTRRQLVESAAPALSQSLLAAPPSIPPGAHIATAHVLSASVQDGATATVAFVDVLLRRPPWSTTTLSLTLTRTDGAWHVKALA